MSLNTASSSTSLKSSSSTCSSSPPFQFQPHRPRTMEDVWKDINLSALGYDHSSSAAEHLRLLPNPTFIFQDFLATPAAAQDPATPAVAPAIFGSPLPAPRTLLSLNSGIGLDLFENPPSSRLPTNVPGFNCPFESLGSPAGLEAFGKKRVNESEGGSVDRRHKRMIKNRESAARSRARKQAYTYELEREVDLLLAENARLKREQERITLAAASKHQLPKKHTLFRASTARF